MSVIPNALALAGIVDGSSIVASDHRNNYAAIQAAENAVIAALSAGTTGNNLFSGVGTTAGFVGAYTAYTPTWTATGVAPAIGNGTLTSRYLRLGSFVHYFGQLIVGSTTTFGTGSYSFSMPINIQNGFAGSSARAMGMIELFDSSANASLVGWGDTASSASQFVPIYAATYGGSRSAVFGTSPWTWATGDFIAWNLTYEGA